MNSFYRKVINASKQETEQYFGKHIWLGCFNCDTLKVALGLWSMTQQASISGGPFGLACIEFSLFWF